MLYKIRVDNGADDTPAQFESDAIKLNRIQISSYLGIKCLVS